MNRIHKLAIPVLLLMVCAALSGASAQSVAIETEYGGSLPGSIPVGETFTVLITEDGSPVGAGTNVIFRLPHDTGDPTLVQTDDDGKARYKPLITGTLGIRVLDGTVTVAEETVNVVSEVTGDTTAPTIRSVTLNPATVNATGETFTVTVNTTDASGIASVTANATTGTVTLTSTGDDEWAGTLTAPGTAGVYTVTVVATDASPNANNATDTSEQISVIPPSEEQETSYDVNNTATEDGNTVTISDNDTITGTSPLNDTVSIDLGGDYNLVIEINVNSTDNTTGTVASVTLDTPAVTASGTTWEQNESADIDLNLNDSIWTGSNTPKLIIQPLNNIEDKLGDDALENATSAILELHGATTAMVVQATLSGIDESDVKSLPIEMTVDADWYNSQDKVYLFKFDENGVEKQRQLPNSVSHNETSGTYTLSFEMNGFSIFALVGTKTTTSSHHGGSSGGGSGTYPPGWGTTPAVTATAAHGATPGATHKVTPPAGEAAVTKPTTKPAAAEKATPAGAEETSTKKKPGIPGFTAVFAIAGLLAIAYVLMRRRE